MSNKQHTVKLNFVRSTKNTHVYAIDDDNAVCEQVYLNKSALGEEPPAEVTIIVQPSTKKAKVAA